MVWKGVKKLSSAGLHKEEDKKEVVERGVKSMWRNVRRNVKNRGLRRDT